MAKKPNPKIFMIMTGAALVIGIGACYFEQGSNTEIQGKVAQLRRDDKDEKTLQAELEKLQLNVSDSSEKLNHLESSVSQAEYVPTLLKELEKTGMDHGIAVLGVRPVPHQDAPLKEGQKKPRKKPYTELDIEVRGRGAYKSVMSFVAALQVFPKIVAARTIELTPKVDPDSKNLNLDVTVKLRTYLFTPPATEKKTAALQEKSNG